MRAKFIIESDDGLQVVPTIFIPIYSSGVNNHTDFEPQYSYTEDGRWYRFCSLDILLRVESEEVSKPRIDIEKFREEFGATYRDSLYGDKRLVDLQQLLSLLSELEEFRAVEDYKENEQ